MSPPSATGVGLSRDLTPGGGISERGKGSPTTTTRLPGPFPGRPSLGRVGIESSERRGEPIEVGATTVVPVVRTWSFEAGGRGWLAGAVYAGPALDVTHGDGRTERVAIPDHVLWVRLGAVAFVLLAILMGGRR